MTIVHLDPSNPSDLHQEPHPENVIHLDLITTMPINPDQVLKAAIGQVKEVYVIGWDKEGDLYFAGSHGNGGNVMWLMECVKKMLLKDVEAD